MKQITDISERILKILKYLDVSRNDFALTLGYSRSQSIYDIINKKSKPSFDFFSKFCNSEYSAKINLNWLITGKGVMLTTENDSHENNFNETNEVYKLKTDQLQKHQLIPLYNIEASAGLVALFQQHNDTKPIDTIQIPNLPKCDGAVFVTGDSMYPLLKSGDIIVYKQIEDFENDIFWGEMYLISVEVSGEEYISVKYIQKSEKGDQYIKLVSRNDHHQPKNVRLDKVRAMALIKAYIRINSMG